MINLPSRLLAAVRRLRRRFGAATIRRATGKPVEEPVPAPRETQAMSDSRRESVLAAASDLWQHSTHLEVEDQRTYLRTGLRKLR